MTERDSEKTGSFEGLGLAPVLADRLAELGIDDPTRFQRFAVPLLRRGNNVVARAGPGAGTLVAYGAPLLDRLPLDDEEGGGGPAGLVLVPTADAADALARSLAGLALATGHAVAALDGAWRNPEGSHVLFAEPRRALAAVRDSRLKLDALRSFVVDGSAAIRSLGEWEAVETLLGLVSDGVQRVVLGEPLEDEVEDFAERHLGRAMRYPPKAAPGEEESPPGRGVLRYVATEGDREETLARVVEVELYEGDLPLVVHCRGDADAASVLETLSARGWEAGGPGEEVPVRVASEGAGSGETPDPGGDAGVTISYGVPPDDDALLRRHGGSGRATVLAAPRELPHLRALAERSGFQLRPFPLPASSRRRSETDAFRSRVREALQERDLGPYLLLLDPIFRHASPEEVAAALAALLRTGGAAPAGADAPPGAPAGSGAGPPSGRGAARRGDEGPAWTRLFLSLGEKDGTRPGEIVGTITGEVGIDGSRIGKIEIRDTFSLVEVDRAVAERVIESLNGTTIRGRALRVDYDRKTGGRPRPRRRSRS